MFFHFLTSKRFWHPHARCVRLWMCVCVIFFSLVSFRRTNNVAIFWSIWHNFSAENTISFDRWSIYSNANCMQKKNTLTWKTTCIHIRVHLMIYFYVCSNFLFVFCWCFVFRYPQSFVYFIWAHFTLDTICANLYYSHIFLVHFSYTREPTNKKRFSHFLIVVFWKLNKNQMSSIFRMPLDDLFCSPIYKTQHAVDIWEWNNQLIISSLLR